MMKKTNTIVLVERDDQIAEKMNGYLRNFGYTISRHITGISTLISILLKDKPDLILMEVRADKELEDVENAKLIIDNYKIPVVLIGSSKSKSVVERSRCSEFLNFVLKPIIEKDLISIIELTLFRHGTELKLIESEKKYYELSNSIFQVILECDLKGKILFLNNYGLEMFGVTDRDLYEGILIHDFVQKNNTGSILEVCKQSAFIDDGNLNKEFTLINSFGKKFIVEELLTPVYTDYKLTGYRGILMDITNKKLKQRLCLLFNEINSSYDRADADFSEISDYLIKELKDILPCLENIYFDDFSDKKNSLEKINLNPACFKDYSEFVMKQNKPLLLQGRDLANFNKREMLSNTLNINACWVGFPIVSKLKPYGVFVLSSEINRNAISLSVYEKLIDFFDNINLFLEKVNYLKELTCSENLFKSLVNTINEGLVKIDLNCNVNFVNNRLKEMSDYEHDDVIGKKAINFLGSDGVKVLAKVINDRKKGVSSQYELNVRTKFGSYKQFYVNGAPYRDEKGEIIGALGTFTDITKKKEQLALFSANETLLREITSTIDVAFWIYSFETKSIQYLSPAFEIIFEEQLEEIYKNNSLRKYIHPDDVKAVLENNRQNLGSGEYEISYRILTPEGKLKWIKDKSVLVKGSEGQVIKMIGYLQEITKFKSVEAKLVRSEIEKENIIKSIPDSFIVINKEYEILSSYFKTNETGFLNSKANRVFGKRIVEVFNARVANLIIEKANLCSSSLKTQVFEVDSSVNKVVLWFEIRMSCMTGEKVLMLIRNITAVKNNLNNIHKLFNITEQTKELIMITDVSGIIEYVNPTFTSVTGYLAQEVIGGKPNVLKSKKHHESFYKNVWNTLKAGEVFKGDFYNNTKSGELFIEEKIITPYVDENGEITNFISTGRDVTRERLSALKTSKHSHLERVLAVKKQRNRTLSLIQGHENERKKFAREIHEGLNQMLSAAMMNLENISASDLMTTEQRGKIELVNKMFGEIIQELRGISINLSPVSLFEFGLYPVIRQMVKRLNLTNKDVEINLKSNIEGLRFNEEVEINLFRIIQEVIQNATKHSKANKISFTLNYNQNKLILLIKDNGVGMNMREFGVKKKKAFGISMLEERATILGAQLEMTTHKNKGFEFNMVVPTKIKEL